MENALLVFTGVIGGLIAGILGLGGGIFYILILPFVMEWFGIPAEQATPFVVANSLIGIAFASGISVITQFKELKKYIKESLLIGIPATIISLLVTNYIVHTPWFSKEIFNVLVIFLMLFILFQMIFKRKQDIPKELLNKKIKVGSALYSGSSAGLISALSGLGGGIVIIPILQLHLLQSLQKAKIISLAIIFMSSTFISIQNLLSTPVYHLDGIVNIGFVIPSISIPLILGVIIGGPLGVKMSKTLTENQLNSLFILFVIMVLTEKSLSLF